MIALYLFGSRKIDQEIANNERLGSDVIPCNILVGSSAKIAKKGNHD